MHFLNLVISGKCTAWNSGTCGAPSASGRRPAHASARGSLPRSAHCLEIGQLAQCLDQLVVGHCLDRLVGSLPIVWLAVATRLWFATKNKFPVQLMECELSDLNRSPHQPRSREM